MTFFLLRLTKCAALVLALSRAPALFSQTSNAVAAYTLSGDRFAVLPDAPSYSTSQEPTQTPSPAQSPTPGQTHTPSQAQQQTTPPASETDEQRKAREREEAARQVEAEKKQRIGGIIPDFNVQMGGPFVPLSPGQKFDLSFHTIIDPYTFALAIVFGGGLGELEDSHPDYGHGPQGLGKRIGASYLDNISGNLIGNALLPTVLHQDPRYFRKGTGSIKSRIIYSALTTVICKGDNGKRQFNISNVGGNFIAGAISNAYYPASERGVGLTIDNALLVTLEGMLGAQLLEFSPDVTDLIRRHHQNKLAAKAAAAATTKATQHAADAPVVVQPAPPASTTPPKP